MIEQVSSKSSKLQKQHLGKKHFKPKNWEGWDLLAKFRLHKILSPTG